MALIFFCASYLVTLKVVIEPRNAYLTEKGVDEELKKLKEQIAKQQQEIINLQDEIEIYKNINE